VGSATLCNPSDVSYDSTSGAFYIADNGNALIRCWAVNSGPYCGQTSASANTVYTLAGTGTQADSGDGAGAVGGQNTSPGAASVYFCHGVDAVPGGGLYLLEYATNADVREIYGPDP
jgi:hypothetical protein